MGGRGEDLDEEYCCEDGSRCRGDNCCEECDEGDRNCYCEGRTCLIIPKCHPGERPRDFKGSSSKGSRSKGSRNKGSRGGDKLCDARQCRERDDDCVCVEYRDEDDRKQDYCCENSRRYDCEVL